MTFTPIVLEAFRAKHEVEIETTSAAGETHRVIVWIVVAAGVPYVRSVRGPRGRWWRELSRSGRGAIHVGERRIPVKATVIRDDAEIARVSAAIREKYTRPVASVQAMVRDEVLATTARLEAD